MVVLTWRHKFLQAKCIIELNFPTERSGLVVLNSSSVASPLLVCYQHRVSRSVLLFPVVRANRPLISVVSPRQGSVSLPSSSASCSLQVQAFVQALPPPRFERRMTELQLNFPIGSRRK